MILVAALIVLLLGAHWPAVALLCAGIVVETWNSNRLMRQARVARLERR